MTDRISCCVPFCRRTYHNREGFGEWICAVHWRAVPRRMKRRRRLALRAAERASEKFHDQYAAQDSAFTEAQFNRAWVARELGRKMWERCKREAIERSVGI